MKSVTSLPLEKMFSKRRHPPSNSSQENNVKFSCFQSKQGGAGRRAGPPCQLWGRFKWHLISCIQVGTMMLHTAEAARQDCNSWHLLIKAALDRD